MKKYIIIMVILVVSLTSCTTTEEDDNKTCGPDQELIDEQCVDKEEDIDDDLIDNTECPELSNGDGYLPVWCDEFNYDGLPDSTKWSYDVGGHGWGNNELQYYTESDLDNARVEDGNLIITAIKENLGSNSYTSARLVTKEKGDWLYGKIQVKAKLPSGVGTWPAIWMLPTDWAYGGWPHSGEIDIMEHVGYEENKVYSTIHTGAYNHMLGTHIGFEHSDSTLESEFHVYEIEWEPGIITSYIDGLKYATFTYDPNESEGIDLSSAWPFDQDFHLILNIAVGGSWGGQQGIDESIWPQEMIIDYVRVYQKDYITGDEENPSQVVNIEASNITSSTAFVKWDQATDDKMVKEYEVYVNGNLFSTHSHNAASVYGLLAAQSNTIGVKAVDFSGNKSVITEISVLTTTPPSIDGIIEAEDYVNSHGIDTDTANDTGGGLYVGWTDNGDYIEYVLNVEEVGTYTVDFRVASGLSGGTFQFATENNTFNMQVPATGSWQNWTTITSNQINLEAGVYTFKITFTSQGTNLNYFEFKKVE